MPVAIQEFVDSGGVTLRLDPQASVLRGVKLLGLTSRNNRVYQESALRHAIALYEGARVNVNHPQGDPLGPRDYRDRLGVVRNVELRAGVGLFGSLHFNPRHPLAEQLVWDAEHAPENVGLSHNVLANTRRDGEQVVVESIVHVQSVDLVADPATTNGLFEHQTKELPAEQFDWQTLTLEELERHRPDLLEPLQQEVEKLREVTETARLREESLELLAEYGLCAPCEGVQPRPVGRQFLRTLQVVADLSDRRRLVQEHASLLRDAEGSPAPSSREQPVGDAASQQPAASRDEFVAAIKARR